MTPKPVEVALGGQLFRATFAFAARPVVVVTAERNLDSVSGRMVVRVVVDLECASPSILDSIDF
jgi:hypothetical protein